jgi:hypothetical protein
LDDKIPYYCFFKKKGFFPGEKGLKSFELEPILVTVTVGRCLLENSVITSQQQIIFCENGVARTWQNIFLIFLCVNQLHSGLEIWTLFDIWLRNLGGTMEKREESTLRIVKQQLPAV